MVVKQPKHASTTPVIDTKTVLTGSRSNTADVGEDQASIEVGGHSSNSVLSPVRQRDSTTQVTVVTGA